MTPIDGICVLFNPSYFCITQTEVTEHSALSVARLMDQYRQLPKDIVTDPEYAKIYTEMQKCVPLVPRDVAPNQLIIPGNARYISALLHFFISPNRADKF